VARHRNRIAKAGLTLDLSWHRGAAVTALLPELVQVHRERDLQLRGRSLLDVPLERRFYETVVRGHADHFELLTVRLGGDLAAYDLCLRDGARLFVYDNRMRPRFSSFAPGLLANTETVRRAVTDPTIDFIDWGM